MKHLFMWLTVAVLCFPATLSAQTISFEYDENGNRVSRTILLKSSEANVAADQSEEQPFFDAIAEMYITISPNPNRGKFTIEVKNLPDPAYDHTVQLKLHSISGQMVPSSNGSLRNV